MFFFSRFWSLWLLCVRYLKGALVPDSDTSDAPEAPTGRRREYVPSADPGSRLPHVNIRMLSKQLSKVTVLTISFQVNLDLCLSFGTLNYLIRKMKE